MRVLGIDPGATGGLAVVDFAGKTPTLVAACNMPMTMVRTKKVVDARKLDDWLYGQWPLNPPRNIDQGVCELVSAMPKQGVSSTFQFGRSFGAAEMIMPLHCEKWDYVIPRSWKAGMGLTSKKNASLDLATRLLGTNEFWKRQMDDGVAEAALMTIYWVRKNT